MKVEKLGSCTTIHYSILGMASQFTIPFADNAAIENAIHVLATAIYLHLSLPDINQRMARCV